MLVTHAWSRLIPKRWCLGSSTASQAWVVEGVDVGVSFWFSPPSAFGGDVPFEKKLWYVRSPAGNPGQRQLVCRRFLSIKNTLKETCNSNAIPHFFATQSFDDTRTLVLNRFHVRPWCLGSLPKSLETVFGSHLFWDSPILWSDTSSCQIESHFSFWCFRISQKASTCNLGQRPFHKWK